MNNRSAGGLACIIVGAWLTACGGGDSSAPTTPPSTPTATAPTVTTQPANATATLGSTASFTIVAAGTAPLTYQWQKGGIAITGATAASYTTPALQSGDDGALFSVVVTNSVGTITSGNATLTVTAQPVGGAAGVDVTTFKNDAARTGQNLSETTLTPANVNSTTFGLLHNPAVDGKVDAQPLYLAQLTIGTAVHNVVFVATEHASVYAIDADTGIPVWQVSLLASGETPSDTHGCGQVAPEIGITSTPVIDRTAGAHGALYVVAMSIDKTSRYHQRLHALDVTTGVELLGGPTEIAATFPNSAGTTTFDPGQYEERAALLISGGLIYTSWTSHCDAPAYSGWVIAFKQSDLTRSAIGNVAPNSGVPLTGVATGDNTRASTNGPAIWMSGDGPAADSAGNIYFLTANGRFETTLDANGFPNMGDYGNSFVKVSSSGANLVVADYFATFDAVHLSAGDLDLGSGGEMLLPDLMDSTNTLEHLVVGAGKDGKIYVVDRDNMSKFNSTTNNIWQEVDGALGGGVFASPAYFNGNLYYGANGATLKAFSIASAKVSSTATSQTAGTFAFPGTSPVVSANGTASAIVWAHENKSGAAILHAYDAANLATELYNNTQATGNRDQIGGGNKFISPVVTGGRVFVGTTNSVAIFGLLH
jgi:hypothetical protein